MVWSAALWLPALCACLIPTAVVLAVRDAVNKRRTEQARVREL
ncbi:hypothetical protein EV383_4357 [Pseudonocardia sediminis]|uniref:Uncharacterized protein n=1 Tax=Pseudonocardia sediminis TaxID=1397368 RepID=A0A4Q7V3Z7_PSEST|nr:hypothetical protein EV383_4357 [Pseudonocardia sediminis]